MTIKLSGGNGVENVSRKYLFFLYGCVEKHRAPPNIFQYKYSVSITYLYNIFLFPRSLSIPCFIIIICALRVVGPSDILDPSSWNPLTLHDAQLEYLGRSEGPLARNKSRGTDDLSYTQSM